MSVRRCGLQWNTSRLSKLRLNLHCSRWWPLCLRQWVKRGVTESLEGAAHPIMQCPVTLITAGHQQTTGSAKITPCLWIFIFAQSWTFAFVFKPSERQHSSVKEMLRPFAVSFSTFLTSAVAATYAHFTTRRSRALVIYSKRNFLIG